MYLQLNACAMKSRTRLSVLLIHCHIEILLSLFHSRCVTRCALVRASHSALHLGDAHEGHSA